MRFTAPVQADAEHAVVSEGRGEEVAVHAALPKLPQRAVIQRDLAHPTPVAVREGVRGAENNTRQC